MTKKELIEALKDLPDDAPIVLVSNYVGHMESPDYEDIDEVSIVEISEIKGFAGAYYENGIGPKIPAILIK